ncbi:DMT family transporter [uncultured Sphingobacterium sp.]|uniref:DMT family transporter n=1 Tax=uncultured Sphingobacterium sp. TaxID=182688 RepID=UPI003748BA26
MNITENKKLHIIIAYLLIYVVWGSTYYFIGVALNDFPPFLLGAIRFLLAGLILLVWCIAKRQPIFNIRLVWQSAISGIILLFIDMAVIMVAQQYVNSSLVAIIASSTAVWIVLLDIPLWKKNFHHPFKIIGLVLGFLGVGMLYLEQHWQNQSDTIKDKGIFILIIGCISWALGTLLTKRFSSQNSNALSSSAWQMIFASIAFWIAATVKQEFSIIQWKEITWLSWGSLAYLVFFGSILAYSAYVWLLKVRPAAEVGTHAYVNPVIALVFGVTLGNENVTWLQIVGLLIILLGVYMVTGIRKKEKC